MVIKEDAMSKEFLFTSPNRSTLDSASVTPSDVEYLSSNLTNLAVVAEDYKRFEANLESNIGSIGIGTDYSKNSPANPFQNVFPLVDWLLSTPASRQMQTAMNNGSWSCQKKEDGKYYIQLPWIYGTTLPTSTQGECCWVPLDLAKCGSEAPLALLCLKDEEAIMDNLVNQTRKFKSNDMINYFMREGETVKEARVRMAKVSMAYFTAINIILGTMDTGTATLKPFHGLQEVMESSSVIKIAGTNILAAFESVACRLAALGQGDYVFACHPLIYEAIKKAVVPGKYNGELPDGWTKDANGNVKYEGYGFISDKLMPIDLTKGVGDVWVLEGNVVGAVLGTKMQPTEEFQRHTFAPTDKPENGCASECDYYYNFGTTFNTNANKLMVLSDIPMNANCVANALDGLDYVLKPQTIVPINKGE